MLSTEDINQRYVDIELNFYKDTISNIKVEEIVRYMYTIGWEEDKVLSTDKIKIYKNRDNPLYPPIMLPAKDNYNITLDIKCKSLLTLCVLYNKTLVQVIFEII